MNTSPIPPPPPLPAASPLRLLDVSLEVPYVDPTDLSECSDEQLAASWRDILEQRRDGSTTRAKNLAEIRQLQDVNAAIDKMATPWQVAIEKIEEELHRRAHLVVPVPPAPSMEHRPSKPKP